MKERIVAVLLIGLRFCYADKDPSCPEIISRSQWGGSAAQNVNYLILPIPYVVIQHTATPACSTKATCASSVENIRSYHMNDLGWDDIGYSFLIGGDGNVYEGCGWNREGAHTYGYNKKSIGIGFIGNFQEKKASEKMVEAAHKLILCGKAEGILRQNVRVIAARQVHATISPGLELFGQIQNWPEWASMP